MYISIIKMNTLEMRALLESYVAVWDISELNKPRPSQATRRACALAQARDLLVKNHILSADEAKRTTIKRHKSGEPYLEFPVGNKHPLHISISHSGSWSACLISHRENPSAIDLEDLHIKRNFLHLAEHFFSVQEIEYVKQYGKEAFYKLWTAKEAIAKLQGKGLSEALKICLQPPLPDQSVVGFGSPDYQLTLQVTQDYIYTIAHRRDKGLA